MLYDVSSVFLFRNLLEIISERGLQLSAEEYFELVDQGLEMIYKQKYERAPENQRDGAFKCNLCFVDYCNRFASNVSCPNCSTAEQ